MKKKKSSKQAGGNKVVFAEVIERRIFLIRSNKVILSTHLAQLYEVEPKVLIQAVKRNTERFPSDFMFQLTKKEFENLKSQIVTSSWGGIRRAMPYAFTEQGVAMLSSVLKSKRAVHVNIEIMRAFVRLRKILEAHKDMAKRLEKLELQVDVVVNVLDDLINPKKQKPRIGFRKNG